MAWSKGLARIPDRSRKTFFLSSARSYLFNEIVSKRIKNDTFSQILLGDQMQFSDGNSYFRAESEAFDDISKRLKAGLLRITAPLIGKSPWKEREALEMSEIDLFELNIVHQYPTLFALLEKETETQRRSISVLPKNLAWHWLDKTTLSVSFYLPAGSYATSVIREVVISPNELIE
jgi:tRNA pseudouridine13 synthase